MRQEFSLQDLNEAQAGADHANQPGDRSLHVVRRLRRAFLSICRCGDVMFSPYRLTTEQYSLMRAVLREPGVRQVDIKDRIFAEPNTVTAMVTLLERRGILRRKPSPVDGRARLLYLTAHGQAVMARLYEDWEPMRQVIHKCFAGKAGQEALEILDAVYSEMEQARESLLKKSWMQPTEPEPMPQSVTSHKKKTTTSSRTARATSSPARRKKTRSSANAPEKHRRS
jgi:DNA-binding MarR family transcriptional regulator